MWRYGSVRARVPHPMIHVPGRWYVMICVPWGDVSKKFTYWLDKLVNDRLLMVEGEVIP